MIISASRRTDIPAFYGDWFINRLKDGYVLVKNPMNAHQISKIILSPEVIDCIVFWTKNPEKFLENLKIIDDYGYKYYFQFTITTYNSDIEVNVPEKNSIIKTFIRLSEQIGKEKIIWRYDPIFITDKIDQDYHYKYFEYVAKLLHKHTSKCIISFLDLYRKCERNFKDKNVKSLSDEEMKVMSEKLLNIAKSYNLNIETCAEKIDLSDIGIVHGKCIDDELISKIVGEKIILKKDKYQRDICGCMESVDIGAYDSCPHNCLYCYANSNKELMKKNILTHNKQSSLLLGEVKETDKIIEKKVMKCKRIKNDLFG